MTIHINLTNITAEISEVKYMYDVVVDGKWVKFDTITRETLPMEWLMNYFQKWAYRTYKTENADIVLTFAEVG